MPQLLSLHSPVPILLWAIRRPELTNSSSNREFGWPAVLSHLRLVVALLAEALPLLRDVLLEAPLHDLHRGRPARREEHDQTHDEASHNMA